MIRAPLVALVRKDLQLYLADRRALLLVILLPIAFASFFGAMFGGKSGQASPTGIAVLWVDDDRSAVSERIRDRLTQDGALALTDATAPAARTAVAEGDARVAVHLPKGFAEAAKTFIANGGDKPAVELWYDPSHPAELQLVRGRLTGQIVQVVEQSFFVSDDMKRAAGLLARLEQRPELPADERAAVAALRTNVARYGSSLDAGAADATADELPYRFAEQATMSGDEEYNGYSHAFAGSGVQFVLFGAIEAGVAILLERQRAIWRRLRVAPIPRSLLLLGRLISATLFCLLALLTLYAFGFVVFGVGIEGSVLGFAVTCVVYAVLAGTFGLALAALGKTPAAARAPAIVVVLMMSMIGGTMVPTFMFPSWMQRLSYATPTRWALDALEATTWRGQGLSAVLLPCAVLLGFVVVLAGITLWRFRWDED